MQVAVVGLGHMGRALAERLAARGASLRLWNRSRDKAEGLPGRICASAADAVQDVEIVLTSLSTDEAVREVVLGDGGLLATLPETVIHVGTSTISPQLGAELHRLHAQQGRAYVSAPVLGRPEAAVEGKLFVLAGGNSDVLERCRPLFAEMGQGTFEFSAAAQANLAKVLVNFMLAGNMELLGEIFALAEKGGIAPTQTCDLLTRTLFGSPAIESYGRRIAERRFEPAGMRMALGLKDVELALAAGHELRVPLPAANVVRDHYLTALASGFEHLDWSGLAAVARAEAGL